MKRPFDWGVQPFFDPAVPEHSTAEGAYILSDSLRIAFRRAKPQFITVFFERHQVIRFDDADAVRKYTSFTLPESLDPTYDKQDLPFAKQDSLPRPLYFNTEVVFCRARKLGADVDAGALPVEGRVIREQVKFGIGLHETWSYAIDVLGVLPGDTIEVHWKYSIPFMENWMKFNAQRLFFNGALYKRSSNLMIEADGMQGFRHWGIPPDSVADEGRTVKKYWTLKDLPAVADEVGARWYAELPFLTIGTLQDAQFYAHVTRSGMAVDIPYWAKAMRLREGNAHWWRQVALKNVPDAQTERMKGFMDLYPGTDPIDRLRRMHSAIATTFDYQLDDAWYDNKDRDNQRMGDQLLDKRLREISRYDLYSKLISMLRLKYYTAYMMDARVGALGLDWLSPVWNNEWTFLVNDNGTPVHLHPKRTRFGLLPDEMPFYWEGTRALVGDVDKLWADGELGDKKPIEPELIPIPKLLPAVNQRSINMDVDVDLATGVMKVRANILLTGQWSTLTRSAYLFGVVDSSAHPGYGHRLFDLAGATDVQVELGEVQQMPPFRMPIKVSFTLPGRVLSKDSTWTVDLSGLFHHVVDSTFTAEGRDLFYWFDFEGGDEVRARVHFDRAVQLVSDTAVSTMQPFAAHYVYTTQPDPKTIDRSSVFGVYAPKVEVRDARDLEILILAVANQSALLHVKAPPADLASPVPGP
ncbi:MAG: hypothetical protein IPO17_15645 [Flavobacteriales bacterium]|nr:hypothetical protein [Flavobacteriales bacterium]